jgi:hypothetical protein
MYAKCFLHLVQRIIEANKEIRKKEIDLFLISEWIDSVHLVWEGELEWPSLLKALSLINEVSATKRFYRNLEIFASLADAFLKKFPCLCKNLRLWMMMKEFHDFF